MQIIRTAAEVVSLCNSASSVLWRTTVECYYERKLVFPWSNSRSGEEKKKKKSQFQVDLSRLIGSKENQTFAGSWFLNVRTCCFYLSCMTVNEEFNVLQAKQLINSDSWLYIHFTELLSDACCNMIHCLIWKRLFFVWFCCLSSMAVRFFSICFLCDVTHSTCNNEIFIQRRFSTKTSKKTK